MQHYDQLRLLEGYHGFGDLEQVSNDIDRFEHRIKDYGFT